MVNKILVRFGEMMLKGKNLKDFKQKIYYHLQNSLKKFNLNIIKDHAKCFLENFKMKDLDDIIFALNHVPGLYSYSLCYEVKNDYKSVLKASLDLIEKEIKVSDSFKIICKRLDKTLPFQSQEIQQKLGIDIINKNKNLTPNLINPKDILYVEFYAHNAVLYLKKNILLKGFPSKSGAKGLLLLSGGIDSPVAAIESIRKGINLSLIHFESSPLTPLESVDKVISLAKKIALFMPDFEINLYVVPFKEIHNEILNHIDDSYIITILRRMMYRLSLKLANKYNYKAIFSGDSIGQVASQTIESMNVIDNVLEGKTIIRPLSSFDKDDIIKLSYKYDTYNLSIIPFQDCCTVYIPKSPTTKPNLDKCLKEESKYDFNLLINNVFNKIIKLKINAFKEYNFSKYDLTFEKAHEKYIEEIEAKNDK